MPSAVAGPEIERLIQLLARLPGLGPRSARRAALHLIRKREQLLDPLAEAMRARIASSTCASGRMEYLVFGSPFLPRRLISKVHFSRPYLSLTSSTSLNHAVPPSMIFIAPSAGT